MAEPVNLAAMLRASSSGDREAGERLVTALAIELRALASAMLKREGPGPHTLQPTALVNEAFVRILRPQQNAARVDDRAVWADRTHLFRAAARAMRNILIDRAKSARVGRRSDAAVESIVIEQPGDSPALGGDEHELLALDAALDSLEARDPRQHEIVMLRYFGGLTIDDTAEVVGVSPSTVKSEWAFARAWLLREVARARGGSEGDA